MEKRVQYNFDILSEAIKRDNAILLKTYDKVTKRSIIILDVIVEKNHIRAVFI